MKEEMGRGDKDEKKGEDGEKEDEERTDGENEE